MTGRMEYLIGSSNELGPVWRAYGVQVQSSPDQRENTVGHSGFVYGISDSGRTVVLYPLKSNRRGSSTTLRSWQVASGARVAQPLPLLRSPVMRTRRPFTPSAATAWLIGGQRSSWALCAGRCTAPAGTRRRLCEETGPQLDPGWLGGGSVNQLPVAQALARHLLRDAARDCSTATLAPAG
jgi:hypothetical protein